MQNRLKNRNKNETFQNVGKVFALLRLCQVSLWGFLGALFFSLCNMAVTTYSVLLLFPLAEGIIKNDFSATRSIKGLSVILAHWPQAFRTDSSLFILLVIWLYFIAIIKNALQYFSFLSAQVQTSAATLRLRQLLVEKCLGFGKKFFDENMVSYLQGVLTRSTNLLESQFQVFQQSMGQFLLLGVYLIIMLGISWKLTLIAFLVFPLSAFFISKFTRRIREFSQVHHQALIDLNGKICDMLSCMPLIKGFGKERDELRSFGDASEVEIEQRSRVQRLMGLAGPVQDMTATTAVLFIAIGLAAIMRVDHTVAASQAIVFLYLLMRLNQNLNAFSQFHFSIANAAASLHDIETILHQDAAAVVCEGRVPFTGLQEEIEFRGLSFSYGEKASLALDKVSFIVKKRSIVAIVGPSGSGKSTLINLLLRFYDCPPDAILIDGVDIREYDMATLRKRMAFVSQEVFLFNDTIRKNVEYGVSGEAPEDMLSKVALGTQVHDFVDKLPNKYDTRIGERGLRLSGGERQRLSIARAMMREPEILIMDEATSELDSKTEESINEYVSRAVQGKTVIIIAHRLSTIRRADKIIYLEKGRVVESGTLQELLDKKGLFFKQWELQKL